MKTNELDVQTIQYLGKPSRTDRYPISGWPDRNRWLEGGSVLPLPTEYIDAEFSVAAKALNRILRDARDRIHCDLDFQSTCHPEDRAHH